MVLVALATELPASYNERFMSRQALLLNWVYYQPVGHAIEAFKVAKGLSNANKNVDIHVLLNSRTAVELAQACDWITSAYPIDLEEVAEKGSEATCLRDIPTVWDYVVNDHRPTCSPFPFSAPLRIFHDLAVTWFQARLWKGGQHELPSDRSPLYQQNAPIRMRVPESPRAYVRSLDLSSTNICVLLGGSSPEPIYPTLNWWRKVLAILHDELPDAHFFLTGKSEPDGRSSTVAFPNTAIADLLGISARTFDFYDAGIWNQMALLERCDMLIAPHTGFAFLAPSVGTPWLAVSGVRWPECFFNDVPFYCVLPECTHYPCWTGMKPECSNLLIANETVPCMAAQLDTRTPDLIRGVRLLLSDGFSFDKAMRLYQARIDDIGFAPEKFFKII